MLTPVAKRYASALFLIAQELGRVEEMDGQAKILERLYDDAKVKKFFTAPHVSSVTKKRVLDKQFGGKVDKELLNLVKLLIDKRRISQLPGVMRYFDILTDQVKGVEEVTIVSAVPLSGEQLEAVVEAARRFSAYGKLRVITEVAPGVIGGLKVRLGDNLVIDGTISNRLRQMRERMYRFRHRGVGA
ncbi:ATP synthase F1 subunit delta [bacterium]|nr:ATP synthase F1 subunit delta [bacterium]